MINYKSQEGKILRLLREKGEAGVNVKELTNSPPEGLSISQYGSRILGLRRKGYAIINNPIGHFTLYETEETKPKHYEFDPITCTAKEV